MDVKVERISPGHVKMEEDASDAHLVKMENSTGPHIQMDEISRHSYHPPISESAVRPIDLSTASQISHQLSSTMRHLDRYALSRKVAWEPFRGSRVDMHESADRSSNRYLEEHIAEGHIAAPTSPTPSQYSHISNPQFLWLGLTCMASVWRLVPYPAIPTTGWYGITLFVTAHALADRGWPDV